MSGVGCDFCLWLFLDFSVYLFTTVTNWSRFSSLKYRWKECHTDLILSKIENRLTDKDFMPKKKNYCSFASSPRSNSLVRAWTRQNTQHGFRAQARFGSICSVFAIWVRKTVQESTAKTDQTVWMRRLISLHRTLLIVYILLWSGSWYVSIEITILLPSQHYYI